MIENGWSVAQNERQYLPSEYATWKRDMFPANNPHIATTK